MSTAFMSAFRESFGASSDTSDELHRAAIRFLQQKFPDLTDEMFFVKVAGRPRIVINGSLPKIVHEVGPALLRWASTHSLSLAVVDTSRTDIGGTSLLLTPIR